MITLTLILNLILTLTQTLTTSPDEKVLSASVFKKFQVLKVINTSHNTKLIRFEIPHGKGLGLPIGRHVSVRAEVDGKLVMRG
jgi:cytochrome-b5 reductase